MAAHRDIKPDAMGSNSIVGNIYGNWNDFCVGNEVNPNQYRNMAFVNEKRPIPRSQVYEAIKALWPGDVIWCYKSRSM